MSIKIGPFIYMRNNTGPKTEPCGTPESIGTEEDDFPSRAPSEICQREKSLPIPKYFPLPHMKTVCKAIGFEQLYQMFLQSPSLQHHFECLSACYMLCHEQILRAEFRSYVWPENGVEGDKECYSF